MNSAYNTRAFLRGATMLDSWFAESLERWGIDPAHFWARPGAMPRKGSIIQAGGVCIWHFAPLAVIQDRPERFAARLRAWGYHDAASCFEAEATAALLDPTEECGALSESV